MLIVSGRSSHNFIYCYIIIKNRKTLSPRFAAQNILPRFLRKLLNLTQNQSMRCNISHPGQLPSRPNCPGMQISCWPPGRGSVRSLILIRATSSREAQGQVQLHRLFADSPILFMQELFASGIFLFTFKYAECVGHDLDSACRLRL